MRITFLLALLLTAPALAGEPIQADRITHLTHLAGPERIPVDWYLVEANGQTYAADPRTATLSIEPEGFVLSGDGWTAETRVFRETRHAAEVTFRGMRSLP